MNLVFGVGWLLYLITSQPHPRCDLARTRQPGQGLMGYGKTVIGIQTSLVLECLLFDVLRPDPGSFPDY